MTDAERVTSAITPRNLVWNGKHVTRDARKVLDRGTPSCSWPAKDSSRST
ncbi:MAG: hypothetical protein U1E90_07195 [Burkholderiaceae bacterium]